MMGILLHWRNKLKKTVRKMMKHLKQFLVEYRQK